LCIYLNSAKASRNFYEIGFKRNQPAPTVQAQQPPIPKPPSVEAIKNPVVPPVRYNIRGNLPLAKAPAKPVVQPSRIVSAPATAKAPVKTSRLVAPVRKPFVPPSVQAPVPVVAKSVAPAPKVAVTPAMPTKSTGRIVVREEESPSAETSEMVTETAPLTEENTLAQAIEEEEAYNLLQQEQQPELEPDLSEKAEQKQPEKLSWLGGFWSQAQGALLSPVSRWIFASLVLLGVFLFAASFVAVWIKKRVVDRNQVSYELPPDVTMATVPEQTQTDFFEAPPEITEPEPETFEAYLKEAPPVAEASQWTEVPAKRVEPRKEEAEAHVELSEETGSLLFNPPKSYGEAIKSSLTSHASPNISAPFKPVKQQISTEGGPKTKKGAGKSFNQYLNR
jgi:hypothetical protein